MKLHHFWECLVIGTLFHFNLSAAVLYVDVNSTNPISPYTNWSTASTNIQLAVNAATNGDLVLVTNGVYRTGGKMVSDSLSNRVAVTLPITVQSVNGAAVTTIQGYQLSSTTNGSGAIRGVYLTNGAALVGFTITNGATRSDGYISIGESGGGVWCASTGAIVSDCVLAGNSAYYYGGAAFGGTLSNCTLVENTSFDYGGGAASNCLYNCTLIRNLAITGGGRAYGGRLVDCTVAWNSSSLFCGAGAFYASLIDCTLSNNNAYYGGGADSCGRISVSCRVV